MPAQVVAASQSALFHAKTFRGAKEWEILRGPIELRVFINLFDSIDWGWFSSDKTDLLGSDHLNLLIGNMRHPGDHRVDALIKALLLPLAYISYVSMAKMKELQPADGETKKGMPLTIARSFSRHEWLLLRGRR